AELQVGSVEDADAVERALVGVDRVIHLAARASVPESWRDPRTSERVNVGGFVEVLRASSAAGVRRVVYASSCAVYGSLPGLPKREGDRLAPESPYAAGKLADEAFASAWSRAVDVVGLRYFNVFGPEQDPHGPYGAVIPRFVDMALRGAPLTVHGDGEQGRDFVSVHDVVRANLAASEAPGVSGRVVNVGGGRMLTINELARVVASEVGIALRRIDEPAREGDVRHSLADIGLARDLLGWEPSVDFGEALAETVRWFRARAA
ncbi:MAG TPA: NAD-dependent epimerase/dehydratase family protein, partial [Myxococcota bacterium]|nr:NAD-dependent epimerase/dehydratase family protein [Myxococcota bacterium]